MIFSGLFKGQKVPTSIGRSVMKTTIKPKAVENPCKGIVCKPKPTAGSCSQRTAASMGMKKGVDKAQQNCCPWWACSHPNGTLTMHYSELSKFNLENSYFKL